MKISTNAIVSNSEMIKSYKACREKAELFGKIFVLKNNQPDAVLVSVKEYTKLALLIEHIDSLDESAHDAFVEALPAMIMKKP